MKYLFFIASIVLFQSNWTRHIDDSSQCSISLPEAAIWLKSNKPILTSSGELELVIYKTKDIDESSNIYALSHIDYPVSFELDKVAKDSMIQESIAALPGVEIYQQTKAGDSFGSVIVRKKLENSGLHIKSRLFFIENRFYLMIVYAHTDKSLNSDIDKFLNSFRSE